MTRRRKHLLLLFLSAYSMISCNKIVPAGFWKNFQSNYLVKNISDQGPRGGHRAMYWRAHLKYTFTKKEIIEFATKNGWEFVDSTHFRNDSTKDWTYSGKNIFPLTNEGFTPNHFLGNSICENFPRWIVSGLSVLSFKTGWVSIQQGDVSSNEVNGFIIISDDGQEFSVYHLWGE